MPEKRLPTLLPEEMADKLNAVLDIVPGLCPERFRDALFESKQSTLGKAVLADLLDAVPIVGDVGNFYRVRHAAESGRERTRRVTLQLIDMLFGILPDPVGGILDLLTPTNTITYLREEILKK